MNIRRRYRINKIAKIEEILACPGDIFLFDIEQTILKANRFITAISSNAKYSNPKFINLLHTICESLNIANYENLRSYGKHFKRELLENNVSYVIKTLKAMGKKVYALTSGYPNIDKFLKIEKEHGIVFDHVICTSRAAKGPILLQHLTQFNITAKCVFIDNHETKLRNVGDTFAEYGDINQITLLHYTYFDKYIEPTVREFVNYWTQSAKSLALQEYKE